MNRETKSDLLLELPNIVLSLVLVVFSVIEVIRKHYGPAIWLLLVLILGELGDIRRAIEKRDRL